MLDSGKQEMDYKITSFLCDIFSLLLSNFRSNFKNNKLIYSNK